MDYEKKYNEALERAKKLMSGFEGYDANVEIIKNIFPELRESEDERVIKALETFINQPEIAEKITFEARIMWLSWLEKQKEQKPNQSEEEREYVKTLKGLVSDFIRDSGGGISDVAYYQRICDWLDERHIEQKPAWSEEDKKMLLSIVNAFRNGTVSTIGQEQWLKSLPERFNLQPKQEWSEEDEKMLTGIIERGSVQVPPYTTALREEQIEWLMNRLKSLRPDTFQNGNSRPKTSDNWKPAQEQEEPEYYQHFDPDC